MASIEEGFVAYLKTRVAITALIADELYPYPLKQEPLLPAITYQRIDAPRIKAHDGPTRLASPRFQFDVWADTRAGARNTANALISELDGFRGVMGGVTVHEASVENDFDERDPETDRERVVVDVIFMHTEQTEQTEQI